MIARQWLMPLGILSFLVFTGRLPIRTIFVTVCLLAVCVMLLLYKKQNSLLYLPVIQPEFTTPASNPVGMRSPDEHRLPFENVYLHTCDGLKLHAWFIRADDADERRSRVTVLFTHANAGNMGMRMDFLRLLYRQLQCNVLILSYRGYGESQGSPSEHGLKIDADTALAWLRAREDIDQSRIVLFGRSLGGAVAIDLAAKHSDSIAAVVVENTFTSISDMVDTIFPFLRWSLLKRLLLRIEWTSSVAVQSVACPILFLAGECDEVVPHTHMLRLHALAGEKAGGRARARHMHIVPNGMHNNTYTEGGQAYTQAFRAFLETHVPQSHHQHKLTDSSLAANANANANANSSGHTTPTQVRAAKVIALSKINATSSSANSSRATTPRKHHNAHAQAPQTDGTSLIDCDVDAKVVSPQRLHMHMHLDFDKQSKQHETSMQKNE